MRWLETNNMKNALILAAAVLALSASSAFAVQVENKTPSSGFVLPEGAECPNQKDVTEAQDCIAVMSREVFDFIKKAKVKPTAEEAVDVYQELDDDWFEFRTDVKAWFDAQDADGVFDDKTSSVNRDIKRLVKDMNAADSAVSNLRRKADKALSIRVK